MGLRICLVTPFAWSQPHVVNEHVDGLARELRRRGHAVTVLTPSNRARELAAGRRALASAADTEVLALSPAVPVSRRSSLGVPVGARAALTQALALGRYDVVHGFEPGLPSLSYLALRDTDALAVATFLSPERLTYPPGRAQRERFAGRLDALLATSPETAAAAGERFPGEYLEASEGVDTELFRPAEKRRLIVLEWRPHETALARSVIRTMRELQGWELVLLRTKPLMGRPYVPARLRERVSFRQGRSGQLRAALLAEAAIFVPGVSGLQRVALEARAAGCAVAEPPHLTEQPELAGAAVARLADDDGLRRRRGAEARTAAERESFPAVAASLDELYGGLAARRRPPARAGDPLAGRPWLVADLHLHTSWSHDCSIPVTELLDQAEEQGLGAIAVTDHNVFDGAQEAVELARDRDLVVIPGEEVKTDGEGEVIGLFLREQIPRGLSFAETVAAIKDQGGLVYVPHPFDRLHSIPEAATLRRHLADIDVLEVYNARLLLEGFNDEALRYARKYNLLAGAGSDAHVLQGIGTGAVRMRAFDGPEEFLLSLRTAEIIRRPKSLVYLQGLKWVAQAKERVR